MASILGGERGASRQLREALREEASKESDDLLGRLNALEFVDSMVGEVTDMPERLGEYRITGLLGRGGMGTVYEAFQESLERDVALKVLSPALSADVTMRERFRSEARATASLHHEHIVPVYDFGEAGGVLYFAMEKVQGVSLDKHIAAARRLDKPAFEPRDAAARFAGVAEALFHAHRRRLLHRDVKPGNILIGVHGTLALADFGLSKVLGAASRSLTAAGAFLGTPSYSPPEQARGQELSPASDLYSLGVTIFEAVSNELPLHGKTTEALLDSILNGTPKRLRTVMPKAPKDLEAVLDKLLQKEPSDRYADGEELARDLRRIAEHEPVRIRRQPLWLRAWRKAKKNPALSGTVSLVAVLAVVVTVLVFLNRDFSVGAEHDNHVQQALRAARSLPGGVAGPEGLLTALTGVDLELAPVRDPVLDHLARAEELRPDLPDAREMRSAYMTDPLPEATALLMRGAGEPARRLLDAAIEAADSEFDTRDEIARLRLYRLYVMRSVASLTASVGQVEEATIDLLGANFLRRRAFFPKLLLEVVSWRPSEGTAELFAQVGELVESGPQDAARVAGVLLVSYSGLGRAEGANFLDVDLPFGMRKEIFNEGVRLQGRQSDWLSGDDWTGLERALAESARAAVGVFGDEVQLVASLAAGREILGNDVHSRAPLRSWSFVYGLLEDLPGTVASTVGLLGAPALRVRGWIDLLLLDPPQVLVESVTPSIEVLLRRNPGVPGAAELRTRLALRSREGDAIEAAARQWLQEEPDHPVALFCRLQGMILRGKVFDANLCAAELLQKAVVDTTATHESIVALFAEAAERDTQRSAEWADVRESYEALLR